MSDVKLYRYVLPSVKGEGWAVVVMGSDGYFSTVSDYGNYAYWWSHHGMDDFRKFVVRCHGDYVRSKLDCSTVLDLERTERALKHAICEARRSAPGVERKRPGRGLDKWEAREAWDRAGSVSNELELNDWFNEYARYLDDYYDLVYYKPAPQITNFVEKLLPRLQTMIQEELFKEGAL